jgi:hypothetical protein
MMDWQVSAAGMGLLQGVMFLLWLLMTGGMIVGCIVFLVAAWRAMKAHESVAESLRRIAEKDKSAS